MKRILTNKVVIKYTIGVIYSMHPYNKPKDVDEIVDAINEYMFKNADYKSDNYCQVLLEEDKTYDFIEKCLMNCQAFKNLNLSQDEIDKGISVNDENRGNWVIGAFSDGTHLKQYYDFIDLDACIRNICREIYWDFVDEDIFEGRKEIVNVPQKEPRYKEN